MPQMARLSRDVDIPITLAAVGSVPLRVEGAGRGVALSSASFPGNLVDEAMIQASHRRPGS